MHGPVEFLILGTFKNAGKEGYNPLPANKIYKSLKGLHRTFPKVIL